MFKTTLDYTIFEDFVQNQPKPIPFGSEKENKVWFSFWEYLKSGSNLVITNYNNQENIFLTGLTTGRKGSHCHLTTGFKKPDEHKFKIKNPHSVYFLNETSNDSKRDFINQNGLVIGFKEDYFSKWKDFGITEHKKVIPIRENHLEKFRSWKELDKYILPFTDLIIVDSYIIDFRVIDNNLFEIIRRFNKSTPVPFNLTLFSFIGKEYKIDIKRLFRTMLSFFKRENIKCNLSIVLAPGELKEHDRNIFTNYIKINSQDSFNYFNQKNMYRTKGTELKFETLAEPENYLATKTIFNYLKMKIDEIKKLPESEKHLIGNMRNRLLKL